jgi:hypothetical protein
VVAEALLSDAPPQTRRRPQRRQDRQRVRAVDRNHPKGKTSKLTELGKMVRLQEAENQSITAHEGYVRRPADNDILIDAIDTRRAGSDAHRVSSAPTPLATAASLAARAERPRFAWPGGIVA